MEKRLIAIASGKGGVGKSILALTLSINLAQRGKKVTLVDLDLGSGNLHTYLGLPYSIPTIADFLLKRIDSLKKVVVDTEIENLRFISGGEYIPGIANPLYGTKLKLMRHIKALEGEFIVMDLSPGVNLNTIDLFNLADRGILITTPEAGAVINAYAFIKGALFRRVERVFRRHPGIASLLVSYRKDELERTAPDLEWLSERVKEIDPNTYPLIREIGDSWKVSLVVNMVKKGSNLTLISNLIHISKERLGVELRKAGDLPYIDGMGAFLGKLPLLLRSDKERIFTSYLKRIIDGVLDEGREGMDRFDEEMIPYISKVIDGLDDSILTETEKRILKLRLYFKPREVIRSLLSKGIKEETFMKNV